MYMATFTLWFWDLKLHVIYCLYECARGVKPVFIVEMTKVT